MAKETKKVKTKAKINWGWDSPENRNGKATRSSKKKIDVTDDISITVSKKSRKRKTKLGFKAILIVLLVTIIGCAIGAGACYFICRDDCFTIIGNEEITLTLLNEDETVYTDRNSYSDEGVKVVSFGRDVADKVYIETNLKQTQDGRYYADEIGTYYIIYKVDDFKYDKIFTVQRIRLITFVESSESDIVVD